MENASEMPKILVIDDCKENLKILDEYFLETNYELLYCSDSEESVSLAESELPDLILLDILMPGLDGFEVCKALKKNGKTVSIPVIFMTALNDIRSKEKAFEAGGVDYIAKPFERSEVKLRVSNQLRLLKALQELKDTNALMEVKVEQRTEELIAEVNERKRSEVELERANRLLIDNQSRMVQSEKLAGIGQLAAGVAHEINNPVGYITSNLGTLSDYVKVFKKLLALYRDYHDCVSSGSTEKSMELMKLISDLEKEEDLDFILEDVDTLLEESVDGACKVKEIVLNLKTFARADDEKCSMADINSGIESTLKVAWNELKYKCEVVKQLNPLPLTNCHLGKLNQVFLNLLVNASHAIEESGTISIKTECSDDTIVVEISDTGRGIEPENLAKLFDPFFTTKPVGIGTGLGLAISHGIIQEHRGTIEVKSELGKGTTFIISLPVISTE